MSTSLIDKIVSKFHKPRTKTDWLLAFILVIILIDIFINAAQNGDFIGYLNVGYLALLGKHIYLGKHITWGYFNTWPPFFSIVAIPLAVCDMISPYLVRLLWLAGSWVALFLSMRLTIALFFKRRLLLPFQTKKGNGEIKFNNWVIILPLLLTFRLLMDNSSHLQINVYMLLMATAAIYLDYKNKPVLAGLILGFSIAIKVYTIFLLLYFLYKRAYNVCVSTITFTLLFVLSTFLYFGLDSLNYHYYWYTENILNPPPTSHMNQGLLVMLMRLFSDVDSELSFNYHFVILPLKYVTKGYYILVILASIFPIYWFRKPINRLQLSYGQIIEWAMLFNVIPLLSPVSWKYYYIFLWFPIFTFYFLVFKQDILKNSGMKKTIKWLFYSSMVLLTFSSELFIGIYPSDVLEVFGVITIGGILLLIAMILTYINIPKAALNSEVDVNFEDD